jgi:D-beta-D-heptose 7-phosphate kinase/D-beta-D-heptose 1-phosphate adenosyltransferase
LRVADVDAGGLIAHPARQTTTKTRVIAHSQQVVRIDREDDTPLDPEAEDRLLRWAEEMLVTADVCVLSGYAKGAVSPRFAQTMIELAGRAGKPVVIDPKGTDYTKYRGATVIKPNAHEAERVLGEAIHGEAGWLRAGRRLTAMLSGTAVLISRGPEGMSLFQEGPPPLHIPSLARNVFDVTGAGDTVVGTLALALASGASLEQSAHLANRAAGVVVGKVGTATVTLAELQEHLRAARPARRPKVHQRDS